MAAGWSVMNALNQNSKSSAEVRAKARFRTKDISIKRMYSNDKNFYSMEGIEGLAQLILAAGLIENISVTYDPCERGEYRIIAGERRWRALQLLVEKGHEDFTVVTCQILTPAEEYEETVQLIIANAYRDKTVMDILQEESQLKKSLEYMKKNGLTLQGYSLDSGRLRDIIADIMKTTGTKIAQIEGINKRLIPGFTEELKEGRLTFSAAYELSGMSQDDQDKMLQRHKENELSLKEVKEAKQRSAKKKRNEQEKNSAGNEERLEEVSTAPKTESIGDKKQTSSDDVDIQDKNVSSLQEERQQEKAEKEKTPEQRYNEEQAAIDRETNKHLQEKEQEEKMNNLPSDMESQISAFSPAGSEQKCIRLSRMGFKSIKDGIQTYLILKNDDYSVGMGVKVLEFAQGRATGNELNLEIIQMDDENTSSALVKGFCVIGIRQIDR